MFSLQVVRQSCLRIDKERSSIYRRTNSFLNVLGWRRPQMISLFSGSTPVAETQFFFRRYFDPRLLPCRRFIPPGHKTVWSFPPLPFEQVFIRKGSPPYVGPLAATCKTFFVRLNWWVRVGLPIRRFIGSWSTPAVLSLFSCGTQNRD